MIWRLVERLEDEASWLTEQNATPNGRTATESVQCMIESILNCPFFYTFYKPSNFVLTGCKFY